MLCDWVERFEGRDVSDEARAISKDLLADALACAAAGSEEPAVVMLKDAVARSGSSGTSSLVGEDGRVALADAVLINGTMVRAQDLNDAYVQRASVGHPSDNTVALLAVAELASVSGERFLAAIILCYEIYCRLLDELPPDSDWDHTAVSAVAVPLSLSWMLGLDRPATRAAVSLSVTFERPSSEVRRGQLSAAKSIANAEVAASACRLTYLAASGMRGPSGGLDGRSGWLRTVAGGADLSRVLSEPLHRLKVEDVSLKAFPCIGTAQAAVAAAVQARPGFLALDRTSVRVHVDLPNGPLMVSQVADGERWHPTTRETADHSIPYLVAIALLEGEISAEQYERRMWEDECVARVMAGLTLSADGDAGLGLGGARITLTTPAGGEVRAEVDTAPGHPSNPIRGDAFRDRFTSNAARVWDRSHGLEILSWIDAMDEQPSVRALAGLLRTRAP